MYIQFLNTLEKYAIKEENIKILSSNKIAFYNSNIPENISGFNLYLENKDNTIISYKDYKVIHRQNENTIVFTSDLTIYYLYFNYDNDGFIYTYTVSKTLSNEPNMILFRSGQGAIFQRAELSEYLDSEGLPKLKVVNSSIEEVNENDIIFLKERRLRIAKEEKIKYLSELCEKNIVFGITYNDKHFSYELTDQNNLYNAVQLSLTTGLAAPFHADNETCQLYPLEDIVSIYIAQQTNLTHHSTYYNQLKLFIQSLTDCKEINKVYYGQELTGIYLDKYNEIMAQARAIISAFTSQSNI